MKPVARGLNICTTFSNTLYLCRYNSGAYNEKITEDILMGFSLIAKVFLQLQF
jgi:hypothetical protein